MTRILWSGVPTPWVTLNASVPETEKGMRGMLVDIDEASFDIYAGIFSLGYSTWMTPQARMALPLPKEAVFPRWSGLAASFGYT